MKSIDRARLLNVERLAGGDRARRVDQHARADTLAARERVRDGAAELAGADDADGRHESVGYCNDLGWIVR